MLNIMKYKVSIFLLSVLAFVSGCMPPVTQEVYIKLPPYSTWKEEIDQYLASAQKYVVKWDVLEGELPPEKLEITTSWGSLTRELDSGDRHLVLTRKMFYDPLVNADFSSLLVLTFSYKRIDSKKYTVVFSGHSSRRDQSTTYY